MTETELETLLYFRKGELNLAGRVVNWEEYDYHTMQMMNHLRQYLQSPITVIRGGLEHDPVERKKMTCVDAVAGCLFPKLLMALMRLSDNCSWGVYEGGLVSPGPAKGCIDARSVDGIQR